MSGFDTFLDLKERVYADTGRAASTWGSELPGFVRMAESRIFRGTAAEAVRVADMEATDSVAVVAGDGALPAYFLEPRSLTWANGTSSSEPIYAAPRDIALRRQAYPGGGSPMMYTIEGTTIKLWPAATGVVSLSYVKAYPPLTADADTNWLLVNCPGVYFSAILIEAYRYLRDTERQAMAAAEYAQAARAARDSYGRSKASPTAIRRVSAFANVGVSSGGPVPSVTSSGVEW